MRRLEHRSPLAAQAAATLLGALLLLLSIGSQPLAQPQPGDADAEEADAEGDDDLAADEPPAGSSAQALLDRYLSDTTWVDLTVGLTSRGMSAVAAHPTQRGFVAIGSDNGVMLSPDNGYTWRNILIIGANLQGDDLSGDAVEGADLDSRRQELINDRAEQRFSELREETLAELEQENNEEYALQLVEELEPELREQARLEVLSNDLEDIEQQLLRESRGGGDSGPDLPGVTEVLGQDVNTDATEVSTTVGWIAFHPTEPRTIYAATHVGLYRTTDLGRSWDVVFLERQPRTPTRVAVTETTVLLGTRFGLLYSNDAGDTWTPYVGDLANQPIVAVAAQGQYAYVATPNRLFASTDGGESWLRVALPASLLNADLTSIAVAPEDPRKVAVGSTIGLYLSDDAGETLQRSGELGLSNRDIRDVRAHPAAPGLLLIATDGGIFGSSDGEAWTPINSGLTTLDIFRVAIEPSKPFTVYAVSDRNGHVLSQRDTNIQLRAEAFQELRDQWDREPTMAATLSAAARYNFVEQADWASWQRRARWQHVLPRVQGQATFENRREEYDTLRVDTPSGAVARFRGLGTRDMATDWRVTATWDLAGLIFNGDELRSASTTRTQLSRQRRILRSVAKLYTLRRALMVDRLFSPPQMDTDKTISDELRIRETTARLNALTDGLFK